MNIMLWALGILSLIGGVGVFITGRSAIHEILGAIGVLIFAVIASGERVAGAVVKIGKSSTL